MKRDESFVTGIRARRDGIDIRVDHDVLKWLPDIHEQRSAPRSCRRGNSARGNQAGGATSCGTMEPMAQGLHGVEIPRAEIEEFCERRHVRKLALFGSILTDRFGPDSDVDVLVEFEPGRVPGLFGIVEMESELSTMLGRKVDLRTPGDLSRYFRDEVVASALVQYEQG